MHVCYQRGYERSSDPIYNAAFSSRIRHWECINVATRASQPHCQTIRPESAKSRSRTRSLLGEE
jgi:hypothetical protein